MSVGLINNWTNRTKDKRIKTINVRNVEGWSPGMKKSSVPRRREGLKTTRQCVTLSLKNRRESYKSSRLVAMRFSLLSLLPICSFLHFFIRSFEPPFLYHSAESITRVSFPLPFLHSLHFPSFILIHINLSALFRPTLTTSFPLFFFFETINVNLKPLRTTTPDFHHSGTISQFRNHQSKNKEKCQRDRSPRTV